ncbi:MAG: peptide MFS transporter [Gemmataceae bacterium]
MFRNHPRGLAPLFFTEMWERFSFYIMLALLTLYMEAKPAEGGLGFSPEWAAQIYGMYVGLIYFTPFLGGIVADKVWGYIRTIAAGGVAMMAGHLALAGDGLAFFFAGLSLLIVGNGLFKPNISTMLGNLYAGRHDLKDQGYNIFYMGINCGALLAPITATILKSYGWHYAFSCASLGMLISLVVFVSCRRFLAEGENPARSEVSHREEAAPPEVERLRTRALWILFAVVIFFWMAFQQNGLTLIRWSRDYTAPLETPFGELNFRKNASITKAINPFLVIVLTPLLVLVWEACKRRGREVSTPRKMVAGMLLTAGCYAIMALAGGAGGDERRAVVDRLGELEKTKETAATEAERTQAADTIAALENTSRISVLWLVGAYFLITVGELCISPMGLSLVSKLAPRRAAGIWMGGWFVATSLGNYLAGFLGIFWSRLSPSVFFLVLVGTSLAAMGLLWLCLPRLEAALASLKTPAPAPEPELAPVGVEA